MRVNELVTNYIHGAISGQASSASIVYDKNKDVTYLYSYSTPIAKKDKDSIIINMNKYSVTTSRLQNRLLSEATSCGLKIALHEFF